MTTTTTHPPRPIEDAIAGYWRELLGIDVVRPTDHFINLGGDSVRATMLANRIEDDLGVRPSVVELFATLADVVRHCEELLGTADPELGRGGA